MKRSEAVEGIRKILAMNGKDNGEGELEEAILHHLECLGMLPPFVDKAVIKTRDYFTLHVDRARYTGVCKWEPEDD